MEPDQLAFAVLAVVFLLVYRAYLRQLPNGFAGQHILNALEASSNDDKFWDICQRLCAVTHTQRHKFTHNIQLAVAFGRLRQTAERTVSQQRAVELPGLLLMQLGLLRGGWVGLYHHPAVTRYALAVANYRMGVVTRAAATHELFHLMRHTQGVALFEDEDRARFWKRQRLCFREEFYVWRKSFAVAPVGSGMIIGMWVIVLLIFLGVVNQYVSDLRNAERLDLASKLKVWVHPRF